MSEDKTENPNPQVSATGDPNSPIADLTLEESEAGQVKGGSGYDLQKNIKI